MKKILSFVLVILIVAALSIGSFSEEVEEEGAKDLTQSATLFLHQGTGRSSMLRDGKLTTSSKTDDYFELSIKSDEPIYGIYLLWNSDPAAWTLEDSEGGEIKGGADGYWHEYKELNGKKSYTLKWTDEAELAEFYIFGEGTLPEFVQVWDAPCEKADLMVIPTHAGDEHLYFGGALPYYAGERGLAVQLVYLIKHAPERQHELLDGLWAVGVRNYPVISEFEDKDCKDLAAAKKVYSEEKILEFMVDNIRRFKPEVILGHDLKGEDGHGAHILNATILSEKALEAANDSSVFPESEQKYGVWEVKKCYLHLYGENKVFLDWGSLVLKSFDGKSAYEISQEGFSLNSSLAAKYKMTLDGEFGNGLFGLYSSTVGDDGFKDDFLENIPAESLSDWVPPVNPPSTDPSTNEGTDTSTDLPSSVGTEDTDLPVIEDYADIDLPEWMVKAVSIVGLISVAAIVVLIGVYFSRE